MSTICNRCGKLTPDNVNLMRHACEECGHNVFRAAPQREFILHLGLEFENTHGQMVRSFQLIDAPFPNGKAYAVRDYTGKTCTRFMHAEVPSRELFNFALACDTKVNKRTLKPLTVKQPITGLIFVRGFADDSGESCHASYYFRKRVPGIVIDRNVLIDELDLQEAHRGPGQWFSARPCIWQSKGHVMVRQHSGLDI